MDTKRRHVRTLLCSVLVMLLAGIDTPVRATGILVTDWSFEKGTAGWTAQHDCTIKAADGMLQITNSGAEPWLHSPKIDAAAPALVKIRARSSGVGQGRLYWTVKLPSKQSSFWGEDAVIYFDLLHDGQWHD